MGLLTIIKKAKAKEKELRLLMVGLDNAGKTSIVCRLNGEELSAVLPTMGFNIDTLQYNGYKLNVWDIGGQKTIQSFWRNYFEATDGLIWVVDSTDKARMADCRTELHKLMKEERLAGASLLVLANKQDLSGALSPEEISRTLDLDIMATDRHWSIQGTSAYTGAGLLEGIDWIVDDVAARIFMHE